jgi:hypothetical protein
MNKKSINAFFSVAMLVAIGLLWWRVSALDATIDKLSQQLNSKPSVISASQPSPVPNVDKRQIFKLIDSAKSDEGTSHVGVPWSVERAMIDGAREKAPPQTIREESIHIEVSPTTPIKIEGLFEPTTPDPESN